MRQKVDRGKGTEGKVQICSSVLTLGIVSTEMKPTAHSAADTQGKFLPRQLGAQGLGGLVRILFSCVKIPAVNGSLTFLFQSITYPEVN